MAAILAVGCGDQSTNLFINSKESSAVLQNTAVAIGDNGALAAFQGVNNTKAATAGNFESENADFLIKTRSTAAATSKVSIIELGAPLPETIKSAIAEPLGALKPLKIGFNREIAALQTITQTHTAFKWTTQSDGVSLGTIVVTSKDATYTRLGLNLTALPEAALLRFSGLNQNTYFDVKAAHALAGIAKNKAAGDLSESASLYWSPVIESASIVLEVILPVGVSTNTVQISIPKVMHIFRDVNGKVNGFDGLLAVGDAAYCHVDANCTTSTNNQLAAAKLSFISGAYAYVCTGTLLNNTNQNGTPYLLTANHCISTQSEATSLYTYWSYASTACNTGVLRNAYSVLTGGSTLLFATNISGSDSTLLQIVGSGPAVSVKFKGWSAATPAISSILESVHHPKGDLQKYLKGSIATYASLTDSGTGSTYAVPTSNSAQGNYLRLTPTQGVTEGGSSGSSVSYNTAGGAGRVVGSLTSGSSSCINPTGPENYGRLDVAYGDGMSQWLSPGYKPVFRFYNTSTGAHFFTNNPVERNNIRASLPQFSYEETRFLTADTAIGGTTPVYRFYNTSTGAHFYTNSEVEKAQVIATLPQYQYEGPRWYARSAAGAASIPLYRFFNKKNGTHFYTISAVERDTIIANLSATYNYENIAYYVWALPETNDL